MSCFSHHGRRSDSRIPHIHQQQAAGGSSPMLLHFREGLAARDFAYLQDKILDLRGEVIERLFDKAMGISLPLSESRF